MEAGEDINYDRCKRSPVKLVFPTFKRTEREKHWTEHTLKMPDPVIEASSFVKLFKKQNSDTKTTDKTITK